MRTTTTEIRDGMRVIWDITIPMDDGTLLAADVYLPLAQGRYPVILGAGPYAKGLSFAEGYPQQWAQLTTHHSESLEGSTNAYQSWEYADPEQWVGFGYALVRVDTRGTGGSPGEIDFYSPREAKDLHDAIEWAAEQAWSNGKIGLLGISYLATNQWQAAALRPPHLMAICPWEGANDFYREYTHTGGIPKEFLPAWKPYQIDPVQHGNPDGRLNPNNGRRVTGDETVDSATRRELSIDIGRMILEHPLDDAYYRDRSARLEDIEVPLLSAANWGGVALHSRGNFEGYLRSGSAKKWLEVHGLEHWTEFYTNYGRALQREFFDHFLKDADNGWDKRPPVILNVRMVDGFERRTETSWPLERTEWTDYGLGFSDGTLSEKPQAGDIDSISFRARTGRAQFTTPPFTEETEFTGPSVLSLTVSSSTSDADLFVTLSLLRPDDTEVLFSSAFEPRAPLTQGWLRLSHRKLDEAKSTAWRPWHSHDEVQPLEPGVPYDVLIEVWPLSIIVPEGYRLRLTVEGRDYDHGLETRSPAYGREQFGSGPYWHEMPGDRDRPEFDGTTTLHNTENVKLVLPRIGERRSACS